MDHVPTTDPMQVKAELVERHCLWSLSLKGKEYLQELSIVCL